MTASARPGGLGAVRVVIRTEQGDLVCELNSSRAPISVDNFLRYVDDGHYRDGAFYRAARPDNEVLPNAPAQLIQGGIEPDGRHVFAPIAHEGPNVTGLEPVEGSLAYARDAPGTAASEFFINMADNPAMRLSGGRGDGLGVAVFGRVISGMEAARRIQGAKTRPIVNSVTFENQMLVHPVRIANIFRG